MCEDLPIYSSDKCDDKPLYSSRWLEGIMAAKDNVSANGRLIDLNNYDASKLFAELDQLIEHHKKTRPTREEMRVTSKFPPNVADGKS